MFSISVDSSGCIGRCDLSYRQYDVSNERTSEVLYVD